MHALGSCQDAELPIFKDGELQHMTHITDSEPQHMTYTTESELQHMTHTTDSELQHATAATKETWSEAAVPQRMDSSSWRMSALRVDGSSPLKSLCCASSIIAEKPLSPQDIELLNSF